MRLTLAALALAFAVGPAAAQPVVSPPPAPEAAAPAKAADDKRACRGRRRTHPGGAARP